ncbi:hypothetical protein [Mycolicibacterium smegmatis]|uniref:hypothetical protein n=1 Tax=Mycolicibacterium smegmatis TaxID=1772 RepID=UPI00130334B1|nr:hypothetical protein [Mycolicibacterium smegmatis]
MTLPADNLGDFTPVGRVFSVIANDSEAAKLVVDSAYRAVDMYSRRSADAAQHRTNSDDLRFAAYIAGVVFASVDSEATGIRTRNPVQALTYVAYTMSAALRPAPGTISRTFFVGGRLLPPDGVSKNQYMDYSSQLRQYLNHTVALGGKLADFTGQLTRRLESDQPVERA